MDSAYNDRNKRMNDLGKTYHPTVTAPFHYDVDYTWTSGAKASVRAPQMHHAIEWLKERIGDKGTFKIVATNGKTSVDVTNSVKEMLGVEQS